MLQKMTFLWPFFWKAKNGPKKAQGYGKTIFTGLLYFTKHHNAAI